MPVSALQQALTRYRQHLLAFDAQALNAAMQAYAPVKAALLKQIDELVALQAQNASLTGPQFWRLNRASELLQQVQAEMATLQGPITQIVGQGQAIAVQAAATQAKALAILSADSAALAGKIGASWTRLPTSAVSDLVGRLSDGSPLKTWVDQFGEATSQRLQDAVTEGLALGSHPSVIAQSLIDTTDVASVRLMSFVRSTVLDSYRSSSLRTYQEQGSDVLSGWRWLCANDETTCAACLAMDQSFHNLDETFFGAHISCRCTSIPVVKGTDPLIRQSGADFFATLSPAQQDATLGMAGGAAYRAGTVTLQDFVSVQRSGQWGDRFVQGSLRSALAGKDAG